MSENINSSKEWNELETEDLFDEEIRKISNFLNWAKEDGLEVEVITWALLAMKNNPKLSISDAMGIGFYEWDK